MVNRANVASDTLALVVKSLNFFGVVNPDRLESALKELVKPAEELHPLSVALLNATNGLVASAGPTIDPIEQQKLVDGEFPGNQYWDDRAKTVTILNLVDLGTNFTSVVLGPGEVRRPLSGTNGMGASNGPVAMNPPPAVGGANAPEESVVATNNSSRVADGQSNSLVGNGPDSDRPRRGRGRDYQRPFRQPPWMSTDEYNDLIERKGVHGFILVMPADQMITEIKHDLWLRIFIAILATMSGRCRLRPGLGETLPRLPSCKSASSARAS